MVEDSNCELCLDIASVFLGEIQESSEEYPLGSIRDYRTLAQSCQSCATVLRIFENHRPEGASITDHDEVVFQYVRPHWRFVLHPKVIKYNVHVCDRRTGGPDYIEPESLCPDFDRKNIQLLFSRLGASPGSRPGERSAVSLNPEQVDVERLKRWISYCDLNHSGVCHSIRDPWKTMDGLPELLFIDVEQKCIVANVDTPKYLALSYVWGHQNEPLTTTRATVSTLGYAGSLDLDSPSGVRLPRTIRDAMQLTQKLNLRYLWVDRLCIIQDDDNHREIQLAAMAEIYNHAYFTIVASEGDDSHGLRGVTSPCLPRPVKDMIHLPRGVILCFHRNEMSLESKQKYWTRGWTLQEFVLSRRRLVFDEIQASWSCFQSNFLETLGDEVSEHPRMGVWLDTVDAFSSRPDLRTYFQLARIYSTRQLTYQSDAINAFSAVSRVMSRSMRGGLLFGLPEFMFDGMLLWQPSSPMRRRTDPEGHQIACAPSWSFLGWTGVPSFFQPLQLNPFLTLTLMGQDRSRESYLSLSPSTTFCKRSQNLATCEVVESIFFRIESLFNNSEKQPAFNDLLQRGGSVDAPDQEFRVKQIVADPETGPGQCGQSFVPDSTIDRGTKPVSPLPSANKLLDAIEAFGHYIDTPSKPLQPDRRKWSPVIEFKTTRSSLRAGKRLDEGIFAGMPAHQCLDTSLVDENGNVIGSLRLNTDCEADIPTGDVVELISISKGVISLGESCFPYWIDREIPELLHRHSECNFKTGGRIGNCNAAKEWQMYHFHNVLWIERDGDIAIRKAVGRVLESYWDVHAESDVFIRLG